LPAVYTCAKVARVTRAAECACGRLRVTAPSQPDSVVTCHCPFCQRRTGSAFQVGAVFRDGDVAVTGDSVVYNGVKTNGVGTTNGDDVSYHFCPTCGSTVFWTFAGRPVLVVAVGNFADPDFPPPTAELHAPFRLPWVQPVEGAEQFEGFRNR
jgi:hypothetical protein